MRRTDDPCQFWHRFSYARDGHPRIARRLWNRFWRSFSIFYFFTPITIGKIVADTFVSHTFKLEEMIEAYDVFSRAAETKALKIMINA